MKEEYIKALENYKKNLANFEEDDVFEDIDDTNDVDDIIEQDLNEQALNYKGEEEIIGLDDLMGPSYGSDVNESAVEVENRGGLRYIDIDFSGDKLDVTQREYEEIKAAIDEIIKGETDEDVRNAINVIDKFGDRAIKVVFSFARKFDLDDEDQYYDLKDLMNKLCLRSLKGRDMITAILIGANSKPHVKLAIIAAGEVKEKSAIVHIGQKIEDKDLFYRAFDALLDIKDISGAKYLLNALVNTADKDEERLNFMFNRARAKEFKVFGSGIIKETLMLYNNSQPWTRPILGEILVSFEEEIIPDLMELIDKETDGRKIEPLYRLLGLLKSDAAAKHLVEAYEKSSNKKAAMIGLGQIKSYRTVSVIKEVISSDSTPNGVLEEAIQALVFVGDREEAIELIKAHENNKDIRIKIHVAFGLAKLGDKLYLDKFINYLVSDDVYDRNCAARLVNKLRMEQVTYICNKCLEMPQDKVIFILNALTKRKTFGREVGPILMQLLENSSYFVRNEIYRLIANTARTKNEILPADVLYEARENADNAKERMVLTEMIDKLPRKSVLPTYVK